MKLDQEQKSCLEFGKTGWYPVEFSRSPFFRFHENYSKKLHKLIYDIPFYLLKKYDVAANQMMYYQPVESVQEINAIQRKNVVAVRMFQLERNLNFSSYMTVFSLLLIPGYFEQYLTTEITVFDQKGMPGVIEEEKESYMQIWMGWIFFIWGIPASDDFKDLLLPRLDRSLNLYYKKLETKEKKID